MLSNPTQLGHTAIIVARSVQLASLRHLLYHKGERYSSPDVLEVVCVAVVYLQLYAYKAAILF